MCFKVTYEVGVRTTRCSWPVTLFLLHRRNHSYLLLLLHSGWPTITWHTRCEILPHILHNTHRRYHLFDSELEAKLLLAGLDCYLKQMIR